MRWGYEAPPGASKHDRFAHVRRGRDTLTIAQTATIGCDEFGAARRVFIGVGPTRTPHRKGGCARGGGSAALQLWRWKRPARPSPSDRSEDNQPVRAALSGR